MDLLIGLLTFVLVLNCALLILLILIQLPKKEAGAGLAFGGAASDALFGAGTGTVLTKVTRHATTFFLVLAFALSIMQSHRAHARRTSILDHLDSSAAAAAAQPASVPATTPDVVPPTNAALPVDTTTTTTTTAVTPEAAATNNNAAAGAAAPAVETSTNAPAAPAPAEEGTTPPAPAENP
ncbi:MAG: preprotein translocase subunit SecG [Verrucomicrobiae bacterium]|nr:preprotein translocase subunit SecG [Verrucomicrobiae bacterium]MCP5523418.1 preprotein translocase subunit SecG [Verrucomicrobiales bacterium]